MDPIQLAGIAHQVRLGIIRATHAAGSGHPGGALGIADVLTALYFNELHIDPAVPMDPDRDRFVLSAAHMVPGLYAVLAERGYFLQDELTTFREMGSRLQGHTFRNLELGVETTGGSLGQGISIALGMALASRLHAAAGGRAFRTYCVIGDGETDEGEVWEAAMFAAKYELDNLCVILDRNNIQQSGHGNDIMPLEPLAAKWEAFNWQVIQIDGHNFQQILFSFEKARNVKGRPTLILAQTTPGKGVGFMENKWEWHGVAPDDAQADKALKELAREYGGKSN